MSQISAAAVKELRDKTNLPMMDCKKALEESQGDIDKAIQILRERNKNVAVKRGERETAEGRIATYIDAAGGFGAIVELRCESPMVTKAEQFIQLGSDIARQIAEKNAANVDELLAQPYVGAAGKTVKDRIEEAIGLIRENMRVARFMRLTGQLGEYIHHDGTLGVMLQVEGQTADKALLRDICAHTAAMNPLYLNPEAVPADVADREKTLAKQQAAETSQGKPANVVEKIAEGRYRTWMEETVLTQQPIANQVKYGKKTVSDLAKGAGVTITRFIRYKVGELT
jgi:elongation factor Ts